MRGVLWIRVASVVTALLVASFLSFPSFPSTGIFASTAPVVNRALKGDRLPSVTPALLPQQLGLPPPAQPRVVEKIPVGCDAAFSPISAPRLAHVFGRCAA
jgi:hypothetical protein